MGYMAWGRIISFALLCMANTSFSYIYELIALKKWDTYAQKYRYFIGLSDFHDKTHGITAPQMDSINRFIDGFDSSSLKVILEDLSSPASNGKFACGPFLINSRGGILGGFAQELQQKKVLVDNVEYRYCRVSSLSPLLNNLTSPPTEFTSSQSITMGQLFREIKEIVTEIQSYQDGPLLNSAYKKGIHHTMRDLRKLNIDKHFSSSVADYMAPFDHQEQKLALLKKLLTFDSELLDFKLTHSVLSADCPVTLAIAGGSHIQRVKTLLQKVGYESVASTSISYSKENNLNNCLGSHIIDGLFCIKPDPVKVNELEAHLSQLFQ